MAFAESKDADAVDALAYFRRRAVEERQLSWGADDHAVATVHAESAREYQSLIAALEDLAPSARGTVLSENDERPLWHSDWKGS